MAKRKNGLGSLFGKDEGKNPWRLSEGDLLGKLDRKPTKFFRK